MDFLDTINEKTIIICPSSVKEKVLNKINNYNKLINIKLYSLNELKKLVCFDYDIKTILYLMEKYNYTYESSQEFIENLYYIDTKEYDNDKLNYLSNLKQELIDNNLLIFNKSFINTYKNTPFIVFGYDYIDSFNEQLLSHFNYQIITKKVENKINKIYKFKTIEEEILFVINKIIALINNKVDINNIYLLNVDSDYEKELIRLFNMFKIPVDIDCSSNILSTILGKKIFDYLKENKSFEDTLEYIKSFNMEDENNQKIYSIFLNLFNKYNDLDYSFNTIINALEHDLKNTSIKPNKLKNMVRIDNLNDNYFDESNYYFLIGYNQGSIPKVVKDEDYISDSLKEIVGLDKTSTINKLIRKASIENINSINNITITYKTNYLDKEYYLSNLFSNDQIEIIDNTLLNTDNSTDYSKIKLGEMLDNFVNYDENNSELPRYFNSFDINYLEYDNKFKGIEKEQLLKLLNNKLSLSYSNINTFFECQFRYYIDNILKLNKYEESFDAFLGDLFHYVLSHVYDKDFDLDKYYDSYLSNRELNNKEKFYVKKLKKELVIICNNLLEFYKDTELTEIMSEKKLEIDYTKDNIEYIVKGFIDKIMYKKDMDKTLVAVVDYKTGNTELDIFNSAYGIGMQLIIYLYLISKKELFENISFVGFYLQKILNKEVDININKTYLDLKNDALKLHGYSTDNTELLEKFDKTYVNSKYISGMKRTKDGFYSYSKVLNDNDITGLINQVDKKIKEAQEKIIKADFSINPKWYYTDPNPIGCQFCRYKDLCFRKNEDYLKINKYNDLSFLKEGDLND